jgi:DNA-binding winged helix-turn-helix (wHTH) protein/Flp pilus assembly protein TadD
VPTRDSQGISKVEFGPFRLDAAKRVLWRDGRIVPLPPKALDLLAALVEQRGDVVTKDELLKRVWPDTFVEEANLSVNVSALRKALGEGPEGQPYIETVSRRGYRFAALPVPDAAGLPTLAVLPFIALGRGGEDTYFGAGLADALITRLGGTGRVAVRPTSAVLKHAGRDPREAGRDLQVDAVLEGKIQRRGSRLRVTVQLLPLAGSTPAWAETFDEEATNVFAVQDRIAEQVAAALDLELGAAERERLTRRHTANAAAYESYLKGRYFWSRFTGEWLERALGFFREAVEKDPDFCLPHAGLADAYLVLGFSGLVPPKEAWRLAGEEARRALAVDETVADAHVSLGYVRLFEAWDWRRAGAELRRAVALSPGSAAARQWHGLYLDMLGRFEEARAEVERARQLDPLSLVTAALLAFQSYLARDHERGFAECRRVVDLDPNHFLGRWSLGLALQALGRHREAVVEHRKALKLSGGSPLMQPVLARSLALSGQRAEAKKLLAGLDRASGESRAGYYASATVHLALGDEATALARLEAATSARDPWLVWLNTDPMLDALRGHRRFRALARRVYGAPQGDLAPPRRAPPRKRRL